MAHGKDTTTQEPTGTRRKGQELYRRLRNSTIVFVALLGAGAGYELGPGWGVATATGVLAAFFAMSAIAEGCIGMLGVVTEAVAIARKDALTLEAARLDVLGRIRKAIEGLRGDVIKKSDLLAVIAEV